MNIEHVKNKIEELKNIKLKIKVYLGRNKYEYYEGYISNIHPNLFVINTDKGIRTFSYADVATKTVVLSKFD